MSSADVGDEGDELLVEEESTKFDCGAGGTRGVKGVRGARGVSTASLEERKPTDAMLNGSTGGVTTSGVDGVLTTGVSRVRGDGVCTIEVPEEKAWGVLTRAGDELVECLSTGDGEADESPYALEDTAPSALCIKTW